MTMMMMRLRATSTAHVARCWPRRVLVLVMRTVDRRLWLWRSWSGTTMTAAKGWRVRRRAVCKIASSRRFLLVAAVAGTLLLLTLLGNARGLGHRRRQRQQLALLAGQAAVSHAPLRRSLVVVTAVNFAFRHYVLNLICSLQRVSSLSALNVLVFSLDARVHRFVKRHGLRSVLLAQGAASDGEEEAVFGSARFNLLSKRKLHAVKQVLDVGVDVLFSDADVVWCRGGFDAVLQLVAERVGYADMFVQTAWPRSVLNSGFYYVASNSRTRALFDALLRFPQSSENDQVIFNRVLCASKYGGQLVFDNNATAERLPSGRIKPSACKWNGVRAELLDSRLYPTGGQLWSGRKLFHWSRDTIVHMCDSAAVRILHNNCILSFGKLARFVVKGLWYVRGDYAHSQLVAREEEEDAADGDDSSPYADLATSTGLHAVCGPPALPTDLMRKRCGRAKCGDDALLHPHST